MDCREAMEEKRLPRCSQLIGMILAPNISIALDLGQPMRTLAILLLVSLVLQSPQAWSQNQIPIQITVEDLSEQPCGLTRDEISGRVKLTLRQYGFTEAKRSTPYIYVNLNSVELDQRCVGSLRMEVIGYTAQDFANGSLGWVKKQSLGKRFSLGKGIY